MNEEIKLLQDVEEGSMSCFLFWWSIPLLRLM